jgi:hypothetical protein
MENLLRKPAADPGGGGAAGIPLDGIGWGLQKKNICPIIPVIRIAGRRL